ncbi:MAG: hypothetical protein U0271_17910 [Polyangiaceae bacterium]
MTAFSGASVLSHLRSRSVALAGILLASIVVPSSIALPQPSIGDVVTLLEKSSGAVIDPGDFVWEPSRGATADLLRGRAVTFLGRSADGAPRDLYRAWVRVSPGGRPIGVERVDRLTRTAVEQEKLVVRDGFAAFGIRFRDAWVSVGVVALGDHPATYWVVLPSPSTELDFTITARELVVRRGSDHATRVALDTMTVVGGDELLVLKRPTPTEDKAPAPPAIELAKPSEPSAIANYRDGYYAVKGGEPAVGVREIQGGKSLLFDGRQLDFTIVAGSAAPVSTTGFAPSSGVPLSLRGRKIVGVLEIPASVTVAGAGGALWSGHWVSPFRAQAPVLSSNDQGSLVVVPWTAQPWENAGFSSAIEWSGAPEATGHNAACVTRGGHFAVAWSSAPEVDVTRELPVDCTARWVAPGAIGRFETGDDLGPVTIAERPRIVVSVKEPDPLIPSPEGSTWAPLTHGQPAPAFIPAAHEASMEVLGTSVHVVMLDIDRFDFRLVAGADEKKPRHGAPPPAGLSPEEAARGRLAFSLAIGKRKNPRGLRIGSSTMHPLGKREGVVVMGQALFQVLAGSSLDEAATGDLVELPLTLEGGEVTRAARDRGPDQLRADLCVLPGVLLVAESTFDSHEASTTALSQLGCERAVALDRGAERPAQTWFDSDAASPHDSTTLFAMERPLLGHVEFESTATP